MSTLEHEPKKHRLPWIAEAAVIAVAFTLIVTACGWLWVGNTSSLNHGVAPDVHTSPPVMLWVVANFPAALLFLNVFGKLGAEWKCFLCVFVQWFVVGMCVGGLIATVRRAEQNV